MNMRTIKYFSVLSLLIGIISLHLAFTVGSVDNWQPVQLPFPSAGHAVSYPFRIASSGRFEIAVATPIETDKYTIGLSDTPPVSCDLQLILTGAHDFKMEQQIKTLRRSGRSVSCNLDYFTSEPVNLPQKGDYVLQIDSKIDVEPFRHEGAMLSFTRSENPVDSAVRYLIIKVGSYVLIVLALIGFLFSTRRQK
jgi:hypothetical protein